MNDHLLDWLARTRLQRVVVIHANHPNEIDASVRHALCRLAECDTTLLNQSVLLRGVNDDPEVLARLSEALFEAGVLPYYVHLLDRVGALRISRSMPKARSASMRHYGSACPAISCHASCGKSPARPARYRCPSDGMPLHRRKTSFAMPPAARKHAGKHPRNPLQVTPSQAPGAESGP